MVAPLYVTIECVIGDRSHPATVNCLDYTPVAKQNYYLVPSNNENGKDIQVTQNSYKRILAALAYANSKHYGIESAGFVVEQ
jgi:hypothetical protein